jgi:hypothetical protein
VGTARIGRFVYVVGGLGVQERHQHRAFVAPRPHYVVGTTVLPLAAPLQVGQIPRVALAAMHHGTGLTVFDYAGLIGAVFAALGLFDYGRRLVTRTIGPTRTSSSSRTTP